MVPNIVMGSKTYGLLAYLYGPGRRDEHTDPHLVASFDGFAPDPGRDIDASLKQLQTVLDMRVDQLGRARRPAKHVWHCSVRTAPDDRPLTEEEWAEVARRVVAATGIAPDGDPDGCRWVAVRHATDHIHIVATTVRGDLTQARLRRDYPRAQAACRTIEKEWGLRQLNPGDGTAAKEPTNREKHKAQRLGQEDTSRQRLRDAARQALAGARDEEEFFARLEAAGVLVNRKTGPSGDTLGYSVALVGERDSGGEPVFFGGYRLAPDLTLPRIRRRLAEPLDDRTADDQSAAPAGGGRTPGGRRSPAATARLWAADAAADALDVLEGETPADAAAVTEATGEVLDALAATALPAQKQQLLAAARAYERASRSHVRAANSSARSVRSAARAVLSGGYAGNRGPDGSAAATLLSLLVLLVIATGRWHAEQGHRQQAAAAREAAAHLRAAYRHAAARPMAVLQERGRALPPQVRERQEQAVRRAMPGEGAHRVLAAPEFDALAAALAEAEAAGHNPKTLLERARSWRELDSADSETAVLTWRVRHIAKLPHLAAADGARPGPASAPAAPATPATPADPRRRR
ncbi:relaxase/mobilization nuclease domain-containing protein [Kitasatospora purpeofusca]|uniref:relaxase/mobilization nuclease domain-containing protein n=1 Tax=Kitasatospora purpeofusca TaxID=67352 RepID=UPI00225B4AB0|nr:relaxase/mobilization nuclease domain-containing protein [Kitasatospora purpeofusca]MCX4758712.1 relaxase/mobilization nuclease domain-containing protein [Kitasatospora purpeofusca]WSR30854.1 relaxase/mobilization nuclease domain-containing protein [Kitasatospora purpeofusca]